MKTLKEESRKNWTCSDNPSLDEIRLGALLRIADAVEPMAQNYKLLVANVAYYKAEANRRAEMIHALQRRIAALKGAITKLKSKEKA